METDKNIETEWRNRRGCTEEAVKEATGKKKKIRTRRGLRLWIDGVGKSIEEKKRKGIQHVSTTKYR